MTENMMTLDAKEGISAFLDKRNPQLEQINDSSSY